MAHSNGPAAADKFPECGIEMIAASPPGNRDSMFRQPIANNLSICLPEPLGKQQRLVHVFLVAHRKIGVTLDDNNVVAVAC